MAKCLITIGKCSRFYLYILGSIIFKLIDCALIGYIDREGKQYSLYGFVPVLYKYEIIKGVYINLMCILCGSLFNYIQKKKKQFKKKTKVKERKDLKGLIHNQKDLPKIYSCNFLLFGFLYTFYNESKKYLYIKGFRGLNIWTFDIIFMIFFLKKSFKFNFYKHQKCSLLFITFTATVLLIILTFLPSYQTNKNSYDIISDKGWNFSVSFLIIIIFVILSIIYSYSRVYGKVLMQLKYISPYILIIFIGVFGFIFSLLHSIFLEREYFIELNEKDGYEFYFEIFFVTPLYAFVNFIEITCEILTIYYLNPLFTLITSTFCYGFVQLLEFILEKNYRKEVILYSICEESSEVFATLGCLVYLEIFELHFCGLTRNLKREITSRGDKEIQNLNTFDGEDVDDDEDDNDDEFN